MPANERFFQSVAFYLSFSGYVFSFKRWMLKRISMLIRYPPTCKIVSKIYLKLKDTALMQIPLCLVQFISSPLKSLPHLILFGLINLLPLLENKAVLMHENELWLINVSHQAQNFAHVVFCIIALDFSFFRFAKYASSR